MGRPTPIDPSNVLVGTQPLKVIWNTEHCIAFLAVNLQMLSQMMAASYHPVSAKCIFADSDRNFLVPEDN